MTGHDLTIEERLHEFLDSVDSLGGCRLEALAQAAHSQRLRRRWLALDPALLEAVRTGCWTAGDDQLVARVRRQARYRASTLVSVTRPRRRRRLALALESSALAVLLDGTLVALMEPELRARLAQPWREAFGADPSVCCGSASTASLGDG
jgi:hypothetical protein